MVKSSPFLILFRCLRALSFRLVFWSSLLGRVKIGDRVMDLWSSQNRKQGHGWPASHIAWGLSLVWDIRLDFICVSRLGFLLRTTRRRPISSTLPILLDRDWERDQDCFLGALLRILEWIPIF